MGLAACRNGEFDMKSLDLKGKSKDNIYIENNRDKGT